MLKLLLSFTSTLSVLEWAGFDWAGLDWIEIIKYASIPVVAGVVGWGTNWAAIELTFKPIEFRGIRPFLGWQGIIPAKAERMASIFVDSTMIKLGTLAELFQQMEPDVIAEQIVKVTRPRMRRYTDEIMFRSDDTLWRTTPDIVKQRIYQRVEEKLPALVEALMEEASREIENLIDFKDMIVSRLSTDRALLNRLFIESGREEFRFIIRSGLYFGFLFGLVQLAVWILMPAWWVLPAFGIFVGYATNWIAINVIFRPLHPVKVGSYELQGLFLKRQKEVAAVWCALVTKEIVSVRAIIHAMIHGPLHERSHAMIQRHLEPLVQESVAPFDLPVELAVGSERLDAIKQRVTQKSIEVSTAPFDDWHFNLERSARIERMLRQRMEEMSPDEFQGLLRPCFQEDEMKLILVGAALGFLAGLGQLFFVFGGV